MANPKGSYKNPYTQAELKANLQVTDPKKRFYFAGEKAVEKLLTFKAIKDLKDFKLLENLKQKVRNEGLVLGYYYDRVIGDKEKKITFGIGHNAEASGKKELTANKHLGNMFIKDVKKSKEHTKELLKQFEIDENQIDEIAFDSVEDMVFNMGKDKTAKFKNFFGALKDQRYMMAAREILETNPQGIRTEKNKAGEDIPVVNKASPYAEQVKNRAVLNAQGIGGMTFRQDSKDLPPLINTGLPDYKEPQLPSIIPYRNKADTEIKSFIGNQLTFLQTGKAVEEPVAEDTLPPVAVEQPLTEAIANNMLPQPPEPSFLEQVVENVSEFAGDIADRYGDIDLMSREPKPDYMIGNTK